MSITDFLLARLEEEERDIQSSLPLLERAGLVDHAHRAQAECDAKRQILTLHDQSYSRWGGFHLAPSRRRYCVNDRETAPCNTLKILASLYESHPDDDSSWRP